MVTSLPKNQKRTGKWGRRVAIVGRGGVNTTDHLGAKESEKKRREEEGDWSPHCQRTRREEESGWEYLVRMEVPTKWQHLISSTEEKKKLGGGS